jgi:hypothetical protein
MDKHNKKSYQILLGGDQNRIQANKYTFKFNNFSQSRLPNKLSFHLAVLIYNKNNLLIT